MAGLDSGWASAGADQLRAAVGQPSTVITDTAGFSAALRAYRDAPVPIIALNPEREQLIPPEAMQRSDRPSPLTDDQLAAGEVVGRLFERARAGESLTEADYAEFGDAIARLGGGLGPAATETLRASARLRAPELIRETIEADWSAAPPADPWEQVVPTYQAPLTVIRRRLGAPAYEAWLDSAFESAPKATIVHHDYASDYFWLDDPQLILAHLPSATEKR